MPVCLTAKGISVHEKQLQMFKTLLTILAQRLVEIFILAGLASVGSWSTLCAHCQNVVVTTAIASCIQQQV